jgi:phosphoribosyl 1,2-cyclic phosphodiesterase
MALHFQSIISGSSGNSVCIWTDSTVVIIDAGFRSQSQFRDLLADDLDDIDGVVVTHLHTDHIGYPALRVMEDRGIPLYVHREDHEFLGHKHWGGNGLDGLNLRRFSRRRFRVGDFSVKPFEVPHADGYTTFGFEVSCVQHGRQRRVVAATDLWDWQDVLDRFQDADFIYVEANHDLELLRRYPNPNSHFHLSNPACGRLLARAVGGSRRVPFGIMLAHLSSERNEPNLAVDTVWETLDEAGYGDIELSVAPRYEPSEVIRICS